MYRQTRTNIMKKMILTAENENRQFAFVKGNRPTNAKTVKAKEKSIKEHGQLSPITVAKGEDVLRSGGHLVDLQGNDIPDDQVENYYAVLDGQHRLVAYMNLGLNLDNLVICEPLNVDCGVNCGNEYLYEDVDRYGLYGGSCNDACQ